MAMPPLFHFRYNELSGNGNALGSAYAINFNVQHIDAGGKIAYINTVSINTSVHIETVLANNFANSIDQTNANRSVLL